MARPEGFEPPAFRIGICCDIQLRYGRKSESCTFYHTRTTKSIPFIHNRGITRKSAAGLFNRETSLLSDLICIDSE